MITLNLATSKIKKKISREIIFSLVKDVLLLILFAVLTNATFIFISHEMLNKDFERIKNQKNLIRMHNQPFSIEVAEINRRMTKINKIQGAYTKWSEIIIKLNRIIPKDVKVSNMEFDKEKDKFLISGTAKYRQDFLNLKESLKKSNIVFDISSPLSNLLNQEDLNFSLTGSLTATEDE
ncbi:MAG: hypothetical protein ABIA91_02635 [Patescibacteria group bacterium]